MPYIKQEDRARAINAPRTAGELNYSITQLVDWYWNFNGKNYQAFNDIIGALEGSKLELYRRKIAYYEDAKKLENGDVYRDQGNEVLREEAVEGNPTS